MFKVSGDDEETFKRLLSFIETGDYKPSSSERQSGASSISRPGPPAIGEYDANSKAFLLVDIKVYRLGMDLDIPELKTLALRNLSHQSLTSEDPCAVLDHIYHSGPVKEVKGDAKKSTMKPPDKALRDWVKAWLKVHCGSRFFDNLGILQKHPLWAEKYSKLRERGSELITDIDGVERELMPQRANRYQAHAAQKLTSRSYDSIPQAYQYLHRGLGSNGIQHPPDFPSDNPGLYDIPPHQVCGCGRSHDGFDFGPHPGGTFWDPAPDPMADMAANYFLPPRAERSY